MGNGEGLPNEIERLVKLETKFEILTENLTNAILRLEKKLDDREENYVTKQVLEEKLKFVERELELNKAYSLNVKKELDEYKKEEYESKKTNKTLLPTWVQALFAIAAVVVAVIALYK